MKLYELFEGAKDFAQHNSLDKKGKKLKLLNFYRDKNVGGKTKVSPQTVVIQDTKTGKIYGRRTLHMKG